MKTVLVAAALAATALLANAGEADVKKAIEAKFGKVEKMTKSPIAGMWEVIIDGDVVYSDDTGQYLLLGNLVDVKNGKNLTAERQFSMLPLNFAMKQVRGNGKGVLVTFEDPNCGYCKKLAQEIQKVDNVTVYTFLYPVLGEDSHEKSKAVWCSSNKMKTWNDFMLNGKDVGKAPANCDLAGLEKSIEAGRRLRINGTPAMIFAGGERVPGFMPAAEILKRLGAGG